MTTTFTKDDDLSGARFLDTNLRGARFVGADVSGMVMRGVEASGIEIDSPWLAEGDGVVVNGVDVMPYVEAELDRRFPGRDQRTAESPADLAAAWSVLQEAWAAAVARAEAMPAGTVDRQVDGEWSFAETLRHLVLATDVWLRKAVLGVERPFHPIGRTYAGSEDEGFDLSVLSHDDPTWAEVLEVRADHVAQVRDFIASATDEQLAEQRSNPWAPSHAETVRSCLHVILEEEWEHLRYALRDLDAIERGAAA